MATVPYINALQQVKKAQPKPVIPMDPSNPNGPLNAQTKTAVTAANNVVKPQPTSQQSAQAWINNPKSGMGGMDAYTKMQNDKWAGADQGLRDRLTADSQRVGYTLTGGGVAGAGVDLGSKTGMGTEAGVNTGSAAIPPVDSDPYGSKAKSTIDALGNYQPFKYDPNTDASYQALSQANTANAKLANRDMEEEMNSRGILNSTVTSDRATEIYKQGADATTLAIPQLQANAFNQYQQGFDNTLKLANEYQDFSNNAFDRQTKTADITGQWRDPQVNSLIQTVLDAKTNWGKPGADKQGLSQAADIARSKLSEFGIDADSLFGSNVDLKTAHSNVYKAYMPTMASQTANANLITGLAAQYNALPIGTGAALVKGSPAYKQAADFYKMLEGVKTSKTLSAEQAALIDKWQVGISSRNADIAGGHLQIAKDKAKQDKEDALIEKGNLQATRLEMSKALSKGTRQAAYDYVKTHQSQFDDDGINFQTIYDAIKSSDKWDVVKKSTTSGGSEDIPQLGRP